MAMIQLEYLFGTYRPRTDTKIIHAEIIHLPKNNKNWIQERTSQYMPDA